MIVNSPQSAPCWNQAVSILTVLSRACCGGGGGECWCWGGL